MVREEPDSPPSRGKHQRSPMAGDELAEESASKRRRHHRHHNHHHHHRRHGKHDREKDEAEAEAIPSAALLEAEAPPQLPNPCDDEREEGEILEEEEPARGSDVESGEIEPGELDADQNPDQMLNNHSSSICPYDDRGNGQYNLDGSRDSKKKELANGRGSYKNHMVKEDSVGEIEPVTLLPHAEHESRVASEARYMRSKTHSKGSEREKKHRGVERGNSRSQPRSKSPNYVENSHAMEDSKKVDNKARVLDRHEKMPDSMQYLESSNGNKKALDKKDRGVSSERNMDKNTGLSPEAYHRGRSKSRELKKEKSNEHASELHLDAGSLSNHYDLQSYDKTISEHEQVVRHDVVNRHVDRDGENDRSFHRERARSRSYSRHGQRDDRHNSRERGRDRESYHASVKHIREVGKESRRERERSSSYSRQDGRKDRHDSRDMGRDRERHSISSRDRERDKQRDKSREKYKDNDRFRGSNSEKERVKDGNDRDRSRAKNRDHRECEEHMWKDRGFRERHRDSRQTYEEEYWKDKSRPKEFFKDSKYDTRNVEGGKEIAKMEENEEVYVEKIESQLANQEEEDVDRIKEESRKRRQAIMEKYKQQKQVEQNVLSPPQAQGKDKGNVLEPNSESAAVQVIHEELEDKHDPSDIYVADPSFTVGKSSIQNGASSPERTDGTRGLGEGTPKSERSADMFCDDIFGESPSGVRKSGKGDELQVERSGLHDNWDDAEGYYSYRLGEVLDSRFEVKSFHGKGVFSTVVRAKDLKVGKGEPEEVAIKIIRNNDTMYKAGLEELVILKKLVGADPDDRRHCVRFLSSFKFRNHLCLVFESLHMNLREVLKKFGRNIGLNLTAVRAYAKQLFIALKHLRSCGVLHCDIKPDNMLVNEAKNVLKLCDFGNAMFAGKNEITPYLVSRFYRAPEIILGLPYDHPMDIWSVGCCLYELYTGKVLFPGPSNSDMLRLHMELKGPFPKKMLRKGAFIDQHFDQDLNFHAIEEDPVTKKTVRRLLLNIKQKDIGALLSSSPGEDPKMLANFKDLLERIFTLDPEKRVTVYQALSHPFITGK